MNKIRHDGIMGDFYKNVGGQLIRSEIITTRRPDSSTGQGFKINCTAIKGIPDAVKSVI